MAANIEPKSWHYSPAAFDKIREELQGQTEKEYHIITAPQQDIQRITQWYQQHPAPGLTLKRVDIIHNPNMARCFEFQVGFLENRHKQPVFAPTWTAECGSLEEKKQRETTLQILEQKAQPFKDPEHPHVTIVPFWHGTKKEALGSIFETGYANLATTDGGFFGKGIYNTGEAEYAHRVYCRRNGALVINWVCVYSVFPVIRSDMEHLQGRTNHKNYDGHFIPVVPKNPHNPSEVNYYPCSPGQKHIYTELVVFESSRVLPQYIVELQPELPVSPSGIASSPALPSTGETAQITSVASSDIGSMPGVYVFATCRNTQCSNYQVGKWIRYRYEAGKSYDINDSYGSRGVKCSSCAGTFTEAGITDKLALCGCSCILNYEVKNEGYVLKREFNKSVDVQKNKAKIIEWRKDSLNFATFTIK